MQCSTISLSIQSAPLAYWLWKVKTCKIDVKRIQSHKPVLVSKSLQVSCRWNQRSNQIAKMTTVDSAPWSVCWITRCSARALRSNNTNVASWHGNIANVLFRPVQHTSTNQHIAITIYFSFFSDFWLNYLGRFSLSLSSSTWTSL